MPNFAFLVDVKVSNKKAKRKVRDYKDFNEQEYKADLAKIDISKVICSNNINTICNDYHQKFLNVINKHAPYKEITRKDMKWRSKPWITRGIQKSIKEKASCYKKYIKTRKRFWNDRCNYYRKMIKNRTFLSKKKYYENDFAVNSRNAKRVWKGINELLRNTKKGNDADIFLNENGNIITDNKRVANLFNDFFTNVAEELLKTIENPNTKYQDYLKNPNAHSVFLKEVDFGEVNGILSNLNIQKAGDIYGINNKLIKIGRNEISKNLVDIFNASFRLGQFPDKLKVSMIIPIHKGESKNLSGNYRPVSLLPIIGKILEKIMHSRLYHFFDTMGIITKNQYGFQKNKSTEDALLELHTKIINAYENKKVACGIFLDFAKAFDTVNHKILLHKLEYYGIRGQTLSWLKSYLSNRHQCVRIGEVNSEFTTVKHGVPQGSILGPLLFLIYINDIILSSKKLQFLLFADDTSIFYSDDDLNIVQSTLNEELVHVTEWLKANKLSLNVKKSNLINFINRGTTTKNITIKINDFEIKEVEYAKYLGVLIDNKLSYSHHITQVETKLRKGNAMLYKLRHFLTEDMIKDIYHAHIQSHINYGLSLWGTAVKT